MIVEVIVTAHVQGDLGYMPRLFTAIRQLKQTLRYNALLIDTGAAWSVDEPVCVITENRAPYIVMDAMGYHVAFADGLDDVDRFQMQMQVRLIEKGDAIIMLGQNQLVVEPDPTAESAYVDSGKLWLPLPEKQTIYHLTIDVDKLYILRDGMAAVENTILPDATITGTVEFVLSEAHYYQKKRGES